MRTGTIRATFMLWCRVNRIRHGICWSWAQRIQGKKNGISSRWSLWAHRALLASGRYGVCLFPLGTDVASLLAIRSRWHAWLPCTTAFDCRQQMKPSLWTIICCAYAWDKAEALTRRSNISCFRPCSMPKISQNRIKCAQRAFVFYVSKNVVQVFFWTPA